MTQHFFGFPHTKLLCLQHRDLKRSTLGERERGVGEGGTREGGRERKRRRDRERETGREEREGGGWMERWSK